MVRNKHTLDKSVFEKIDTEEKAYWLGFLIADGSIRVHTIGNRYLKLALSKKDEGHVEKFKKFMKTSNKICSYKVGSSQTTEKIYMCAELQIGSNYLADCLAHYGVVPNKTHTVSVPYIDKKLISHLLRGIWDGDGSILYRRRNDKTKRFTPETQLCGNLNILRFVQDYFYEKLGLKKTKIHPVSSIFLFRNTGGSAKIIADHLYKGANIFLDRKKITYDKIALWQPKFERKGLYLRDEFWNQNSL